MTYRKAPRIGTAGEAILRRPDLLRHRASRPGQRLNGCRATVTA